MRIMPREHRYAVNLSMVFTEIPFLRRFDAAVRAGFEAVEFMWPSKEQLEDKSIAKFGDHILAAGVRVGLFNFDAGDMTKGFRGIAAVPSESRAFRANVPIALELAAKIGCGRLNVLAGNAQAADRPEALACLNDNLRYAAELASGAGVSVMLEALNPVEFPDFLIQDSNTAIKALRRVGCDNVRYQVDLYHATMAGEDPVALILAHGPKIGHVQFADCPGRHEPGTGLVNWRR